MKDSVSDVRQCETCGEYLVLSRHEACNSATKSVDTKKLAHCQDCMHTKPDEWDSLPLVFKKGNLIKCWRVTPFETVPKTGKRCFRWLSDRFDPDGDEPASKELVAMSDFTEEHRRKLSEAARKRPLKYNFTEEMFCRAKELRTQEKPWPMSAILVLINKEFHTGYADTEVVETSFRRKLTERFPELKGIKAERRDKRYPVEDHSDETKNELDESGLESVTTEDVARAKATMENLKKAVEAGAVTLFESSESAEENPVRMPVEPVALEQKNGFKLELGDLDWENIKKAAPAEGEIIIPKRDPGAYFSVCFGIDAEYECEIKSVSKNSFNVEIPQLGELRLKWSAIQNIWLPEPDGDPRGAMMLETKIRRAIEEYHREEAKK